MPLMSPPLESFKLALLNPRQELCGREQQGVSSSTIVAVPGFWLTALRNHVGLSEPITDRESGRWRMLSTTYLLDAEVSSVFTSLGSSS